MSEMRQTPPGQQRVMPVGLPKGAPPPPPRIAPPPTPAKIVPMQGHKPTDDELAPIGLIEELEEAPGEKKIQAFGITGTVHQRQWKRPPLKTGTGAVRVRSFHGRLSDQGLGYMDDSINEWLDQHPEIEVKFVTTNVGVFEGKMREPALIVNLWY